MKTPEEIKKGLERCKEGAHCNACASSYHCQIEEDALAYIKQLEDGRFDLFNLISSVWHGKQYYFLQDNGMVYSRESCKEMTFDQAIEEFIGNMSKLEDDLK